jgi:flavin-dependent dehydrogenase
LTIKSMRNPIAVYIEGGGVAGQVLRRELYRRGIASELVERARFPREKVCGGVLQRDCWDYLCSLFELQTPHTEFHAISHHWRGRKISRILMPQPMVCFSRHDLDADLDRQDKLPPPPSSRIIRVRATGAPPQSGTWIGFQSEAGDCQELEMHYGRGIYLGRAPAAGGGSHVGLIIRRELFRGPEEVRARIRSELGIVIEAPLRGTTAIRYGGRSAGFAVGDAKLATHPFLGLGMRHAVDSARLLAALIAEGNADSYESEHRKLSSRWELASRVLGTIYGSPARPLLRIVFENPRLYLLAYEWLHGSRRGSGIDKISRLPRAAPVRSLN